MTARFRVSRFMCLCILLVSLLIGMMCILMNAFLFLNIHTDDALQIQITPCINTSTKTSINHTHLVSESDAFVVHNWSMIYFQHVRKSAGTAMMNIFKNNGLCNTNGSCAAVIAKLGVTMSFRQIKELHNASGIHIVANEYYPFYLSSYLKYRKEDWNDVLLVTLLRDPLQRIFSDLMYDGTWSCKGKDLAYKYDRFLTRCAKDFRVKHTSNVYCKVFSGSWSYAMPNYNLIKRGVDFNPHHEIDHVQYEIAKTIIKQFDIILILELWQETHIQLKCAGIHQQIQTLHHKNVGKRKMKNNATLHDFPTLTQKLTDWNQYDLKLYDFARKRALYKARQCQTYLDAHAML
eukprot:177611_1